jgi:Tat protein translocase TatB subunit
MMILLPALIGSFGTPEVTLILVLALIIFGPKRLPEIGRSLGKFVAELRRRTDDIRSDLEGEVGDLRDLKKTTDELRLTKRNLGNLLKDNVWDSLPDPRTLRGKQEGVPEPRPDEPRSPSKGTPGEAEVVAGAEENRSEETAGEGGTEARTKPRPDSATDSERTEPDTHG